MKISKLLVLCSIIFGAIFFTSCGDEEASLDKQAPSTVEPSALESVTYEVPKAMSTSDDPYVQQCVQYINEVKSLKDMSSMFVVPDNAERVTDFSELKSTSKEAYKWYDGEFTILYVFEDLSDRYTWTIYVSYDIWGMVIENAKAFYVEEMKDGSQGFIRGYDYTTNNASDDDYSEWKWVTSSTKTTFTFYTTYFEYSIIMNLYNDNSGDIEYTIYDEVVYSANWDSTGHGSYDSYGTTGTW